MQKQVSITIDGKNLQAEQGENLLLVARRNGIMIPSLCYHRKLSPTGACRLCVTKIEGQRGLTASCAVEVADGMEVTAFDEELEDSRRFILDYLLSEHNEEFDGTYTDEFRELVARYGLREPAARLYPSVLERQEYPVDDSSPVLTFDASKCIKCFRCIKACDEVQGKNVLSFTDRGIGSYIIAGTGEWGASECDGCGECIQLCPTGAIVERPNRKTIDLDAIEKRVVTTCPYCGVGCGLELLVQNGEIVRVNGVEGMAPNDGRLCVKGRFGYQYVHNSDRLTKPLIKRNGAFVEAEWDEALDLIAERFNEIKNTYGSEALAGYSSAKCTNEDNYLFQKFVRVAFGNNNVDYCTRLCHASTVTAMLRSIGDGAGSNSIEDYERADCVLVIGNNMIETHPVTATFVKRGKRNGGRIIVIDPKWTPMVRHADIWLQPRLGTDVALLNGLIHVVIEQELIDEDFIRERVEGGMEAFRELKKVAGRYTPEFVENVTSVPAADLTRAAVLFASSPKSLVATGMGMSQQVTGTNNVFSLINLLLITGHLGREGSGINPPRGQNNVQGASDVGVSPLAYPGYYPVGNEENRRRVARTWGVAFEELSGTPGLTTVEIMQAAHAGKIKGMYIMGENPMLTDPNLAHTQEAIEKLDFLVVQDIFPTETTQFADVILPAASFAEKNGTFVNSDRRVLRVRPAVEPPGEARQDWEIITEIARRMGVPIGTYREEAEIFDEIAAVTPMLGGISHRRLEDGGIQWPCPEKDHPGTATLFLERFNTASGKAYLNPVEYTPQTEKPSGEYPFILNTGRILYQYHTSTMSRKSESLTSFANESYVLLHPDDAAKYGFRDGESVKVISPRGEVTTVLRESSQVAIGELFMPFHFHESPVNRLTRDELDPYSRIPPFKLSACRIERDGHDGNQAQL
ncbi:MAG: formate dehydrogenase subunit alpha, partial [Spirochaetaceae bacterium]